MQLVLQGLTGDANPTPPLQPQTPVPPPLSGASVDDTHSPPAPPLQQEASSMAAQQEAPPLSGDVSPAYRTAHETGNAGAEEEKFEETEPLAAAARAQQATASLVEATNGPSAIVPAPEAPLIQRQITDFFRPVSRGASRGQPPDNTTDTDQTDPEEMELAAAIALSLAVDEAYVTDVIAMTLEDPHTAALSVAPPIGEFVYQDPDNMSSLPPLLDYVSPDEDQVALCTPLTPTRRGVCRKPESGRTPQDEKDEMEERRRRQRTASGLMEPPPFDNDAGSESVDSWPLRSDEDSDEDAGEDSDEDAGEDSDEDGQPPPPPWPPEGW